MDNYRSLCPDDTPFASDGLTVQEIETMYRQAKFKKTAVQILADCCNTSRTSMAKFLEERGFNTGIKVPPDLPDAVKSREQQIAERVEQVRNAANKGLNVVEAAKVVGVTTDTIRAIAWKYHILFTAPTAREKATQKRIDAVVECAKKGMTAVEAAEKLGLSESGVRNIARRNGYPFRDRYQKQKRANDKKEEHPHGKENSYPGAGL